ncbi:MAG: ABC transporter permease [Fibrobacter sp.]|jgi:ABC-2 type transport system permease protein|nr:ABC transporter permease [Fibrobacter sp.]
MTAFLNVMRFTFLRREPVLWLLLVILPVLVSLFAVTLFNSRTPLHLPVGIVMQDESPLVRRILQNLESSPVIRVARVCPDISECESAMRDGDLLGVIQIPPDLERRALRGEAPVVPVYLSGQSLVAYNMLFKEIQAILGTISAFLDRRNLPEPVSVQIHAVNNPAMDYQMYLGLGLVAAIFHLAAMVVAVFLAAEPLREHNADRLLAAANGNYRVAIFARLVPALVFLWLLSLFFITWVHSRAGIRLAPPDFAFLAAGMFMMLAACMAGGMAWVAISGSMRIACSAAGVLGGPSFAFSGITFPLEAMPLVVQIFAKCLPLTHFLELQTVLMFGSAGRFAVTEPLAVLSGMTLFWLLAGTAWLGKRLHDTHFHGGHPEEDFA